EDTEYVFDAWDGTPLDVDAMLANRTEKGRSRASSSKGGSKAYGAAALHHAVEAVRAATPGGRNVTLNREAYGIGQLVAGGVIDETEARDALRAAAVEAGLEAGEIERTLDGAFRAGAKEPRTGPAEARDANPEAAEPLSRENEYHLTDAGNADRFADLA